MILRQLSALLLVSACGSNGAAADLDETPVPEVPADDDVAQDDDTPVQEGDDDIEQDDDVLQVDDDIDIHVDVPRVPNTTEVQDAGEPESETDAGPKPVATVDAGPAVEPEATVDAGPGPEPEPEPEPEPTPMDPEPLPEPITYWDGTENGNGWQCVASSGWQYTSDPYTGELLQCSITKVVDGENSWARLTGLLPHEGFAVHTGLTFWACGTGRVRVAIATLDEAYFSGLFELNGFWQQYRINWSELVPVFEPDEETVVRSTTFLLKESTEPEPYTTAIQVDVLVFDSSDEPLETSDVPCQ